MFEEDLAKFYGKLYRALKDEGFTDDEALKIVLKEAKVKRKDEELVDMDTVKMIEAVAKKMKGADDGLTK